MKSHSLFRPPGEKGNLILRVADGCPWNRCTFCPVYKGTRFSRRPVEHVKSKPKVMEPETPARNRGGKKGRIT